MKYFLILFLICFSTVASAVETGSDFWKHCPGPACPANVPPDSMGYKMQKETDESLKKMDAPQLNERELKLKQEIEAIKGEKQRREAKP